MINLTKPKTVSELRAEATELAKSVQSLILTQARVEERIAKEQAELDEYLDAIADLEDEQEPVLMLIVLNDDFSVDIILF